MRVAIYLRVSKTDNSQTVENQRKQLRQFCERKDWTIVSEFQDNESGSKGRKERTGLDQMFMAAYKKQFELLLVWALDRLTREGMFKTVSYLQKLDNYGVRFWSYTEEGVNTDNELVRNAMIAFMSSFAKIERLKISERTKAGLERARKEGKRLGRKPLAKDKIEQIRQLKKEGLTGYKIAKKLKMNIRTVYNYLEEK